MAQYKRATASTWDKLATDKREAKKTRPKTDGKTPIFVPVHEEAHPPAPLGMKLGVWLYEAGF